MTKIIKLTESDLEIIVRRVIKEQTGPGLTSLGNITNQKTPPKKNQNTNTKTKFGELCSILSNSRDISWSEGWKKTILSNDFEIELLGAAILNWAAKNKGYDPKILKGAISLIFRESKGSVASFASPKEIIGGILNLFGGDHSQGYGQIKPSVAKRYGIDMSSLYGFEGSLDALYKMLNVNYQKAKKYYNGTTVTINQNKKYIEVQALDNDAAFHMAIASHNAGEGIMNKWCETNQSGIANICSINQRQPYKDSNPSIIAVTNKSKVIKNYFPNIGNVYNYMPQFRKSYNALAGLPNIIPLATPPVEQTSQPSSYEKYASNNLKRLDPGKI